MHMGLGSLLQKYCEISCTRVKLIATAKQQLSLLQKLEPDSSFCDISCNLSHNNINQ